MLAPVRELSVQWRCSSWLYAICSWAYLQQVAWCTNYDVCLFCVFTSWWMAWKTNITFGNEETLDAGTSPRTFRSMAMLILTIRNMFLSLCTRCLMFQLCFKSNTSDSYFYALSPSFPLQTWIADCYNLTIRFTPTEIQPRKESDRKRTPCSFLTWW